MTIRTITGTVEYANGDIPPNSRVEFYLNGVHIDAVTIAHSAVYAPLDNTGDISVQLYPNDVGYGANRYNVDLVTYEDDEYVKEIRRVNLGKIFVEDVNGQNLQDLLALFSGPSEPLTVAQEASQDAIDAANDAAASAEIALTAVESIAFTFNTVDDMKGATDLVVGMFVETLGYFTEGDGGANRYEIVPLASGTNDGGRFMYLPGVNKQAKGLFPGNIIDVAKFGVPVSGDASSVFTAANAYALATRGADMSVNLIYSGTCELANPITIGGETAFYIDFSGSQINVISGGTLASSPNQAAITIKAPQSIVHLGTLDCNLICGGYRISDSSNTKFHFGRTLQFIWRGITTDVVDGTCAGAVFFAPTGTERSAADSYTTRTAVGFYNDCNDVRIISLHMGYCLYPIWNGPDGNGATFIECHPFNGSPNEVGGAQHSFTMVNECPVRAWCYNCYFDNGYIDDRTATLSISDSWNVQLNSTLTDPIFRVKMPADPADIRGGADNIAFSMGFYEGAWSGPTPTLVSMNYDPADTTDRGSRRLEYGTNVTRVIYNHGSTAADYHNVKQGNVPIRHQFSSGLGRTRVVYSGAQMRVGSGTADSGQICLSTSGDGAWVKQDNASGAFAIGAGNADRIVVSPAGNIRPNVDATQNSGASNFRFNESYSIRFRPGNGDPIWTSGAGTPEGNVTAPIGSLYTRTNGGAGTTLYVKESGTGNTGWVGK